MVKLTGPADGDAPAAGMGSRGEREALPPVSLDDVPAETPPVLVIGGSTGGLSAALAARQAGAGVVLLDERGKDGGQYYKQSGVGSGAALDRQQAEGRGLVEAVGRSGTAVVSACEVWGAFPADDAAAEIMAVGRDGTRRFRPARLIVATGAPDRGSVPLDAPRRHDDGSGADVPGEATGRSRGGACSIAGNGPLNLQVACELRGRGRRRSWRWRRARRAPGSARSAPWPGWRRPDAALVGRGIGYRLGLARRRVPVLYGHVVTRIARGPDGLTATLARLEGRAAGERRDFTADVVCLGYGFQPANELLRALGARARLRPGPGASRHPPRRRLRDERARRLRRRRLLRARRRPGRRPRGDDRRPRGGRARSGSRGPRPVGDPGAGSPGPGGSSAALWALFAAPRFQHELASGDTVICRCEEVSLEPPRGRPGRRRARPSPR